MDRLKWKGESSSDSEGYSLAGENKGKSDKKGGGKKANAKDGMKQGTKDCQKGDGMKYKGALRKEMNFEQDEPKVHSDQIAINDRMERAQEAAKGALNDMPNHGQPLIVDMGGDSIMIMKGGKQKIVSLRKN